MGAVMQERMGKGDVAANLGVTSLVTNAYLLTGDAKYRRWVVEYVDAWVERARQNGGLLPDNVGLSGQIGEYTGGTWYGGLYGWTWPHGYYNIGAVALVAASNAFLLTRDARYLELPRQVMDRVLSRGVVRDARELPMSLRDHWIGQLPAPDEPQEIFVVPYRYGEEGWFDYQPMSPIYPVALWNLTMERSDWERIEFLRRSSHCDWTRVLSFRTKEESGHDPRDPRIVPHPNGRSAAFDCAVAGIDAALWDLKGKLEGQRVCALLTDRPLDRVRLYASSGCRYDWHDCPEQLIAETLGYLEQGLTACKVRIGTE